MSSGPSEMILLSAGLIVAALVSGVLLQTWDDMDDVLDERGKQGMEDVRTRASLVNDPSNIAWDDTAKSMNLFIQNSGDTFLDLGTVGVMLQGTSMTVEIADGSEQWLPGQTVQFTVTDESGTPLSFSESTDVMLSIAVSSDASTYSGSHTVTEEVRLVPS